MASGFLKIFDYSQDSSSYALVDVTQIPDNFRATGSTLFIEWYSGPNLTSVNIFAKIESINTSSLENTTLGDDGYCTAQKLCNHNEGDCDFNSHCNGISSFCVDNSCPSTLGFSNGTDCCKDACHGHINIESGVIVSPNHPNDYQNNLLCTSQISVEAGKTITIEFNSFDVSKS